MIIIDCKQGTDEWLKARLGVPTSSEISCLMVNGRLLPPFGKGAITYLDRKAYELFTGQDSIEFGGNRYTERGSLLEPIVADYYRQSGYSSKQITEVGFCMTDDKTLGASPDRLVGDEGGLEIKTKDGKYMMKLLRTGDVESEHVYQIQTCLAVTGRKWWDYMVYCEGLPSYYQRFERDEALIKKILERAKLFCQLRDELVEAIIKGEMPDKFKV